MSLTYDESASPASDTTPAPVLKRKNSTGATNANGRTVKRRASKACQCCRARKVRCNVVEHGAPCTNCRLDEVECIVTESKRRKKHNFAPTKSLDPISEHSHSHAHHHPHHVYGRPLSGADAIGGGNIDPRDISNPAYRRSSNSSGSMHEDDDMHLENHDLHGSRHTPHSLYASQMAAVRNPGFTPLNQPSQLVDNLVNSVALVGDLRSNRLATPSSPGPSIRSPIPNYIKPLPARMTQEDIHYLWKKGALSIPDTSFRNALLRAYVEYVHPYMPLIELHEFLEIVDDESGNRGKISLVLFQAVMFTGTAFVDKSYLEKAGYQSRKAARKAFYLKARLLYDFDYEIDRVALVQSLLLMTYWYETPDDQKDTWHWMGVAISLAHTIGLHRNPEKSNMDAKKQKLWKRIWWSCFMRDRLVALGMRRPTRIKDGDYDVPMLTLDDFEIQVLSPNNVILPQECVLIRDLQMQRDLAAMCIAKAKLSLIISHVLGAQYSVLVRDQGTAQGQEGNTRSSVMLFPKKHDQTEEVKNCDTELKEWVTDLPSQYHYHSPTPSEVNEGLSSIIVQRALLHMVYFATVSALHRPQVLPTAETSNLQKCRDLQDMSRKKVREASKAITMMSLDLHHLRLERYLPTTGVTVLLPAIIIHLLDIKSHNDVIRDAALTGFFQCMQVLTSLRDNYAAADYATQFLEAAIKKANLDVRVHGQYVSRSSNSYLDQTPNKLRPIASRPHTPPEDSSLHAALRFNARTPSYMNHHNNHVSVTTPPQSDNQSQNNSEHQNISGISHSQSHSHAHLDTEHDSEAMLPSMDGNGPHNDILQHGTYGEEHYDQHFNELIDYSVMDGDGMFAFEGGFGGGVGGDAPVGVHGESGGFMMDWDGEGTWTPEGFGEMDGKDEVMGEVVGDAHRGLALGKEESAVFLLQGV